MEEWNTNRKKNYPKKNDPTDLCLWVTFMGIYKSYP